MRQFVQARPARPAGTAKLASERGFGPLAAAPAAGAHEFSRVAVYAPAAGAGASTQPIQRKVKVGKQPVSFADVARHATNPRERVILANWTWAPTLHSFGDTQGLVDAMKSAGAQPVQKPGLYSAQNLKFMTEDKRKGRLPTLYFESGPLSGRLRQQHPSGPAAIHQTNKEDYFFASKDHMSTFGDAAKQAQGKAFNPDGVGVPVKRNPDEGDHHFEVTYADDGTVKKRHPSGGLVKKNVDDYDEQRVQSIYHKVIGYTT